MYWFTSKNKISIFILFTLLCPSFSLAQNSEPVCSKVGYTILTVNGIFTNETQAQSNRDRLKASLGSNFNNEPLVIDYLLNPSHVGGLGDLADAIGQKITENSGVTDYDLVNMINDASSKVKTQKLLLVAHSQGNFYANSFYKEVTGINKVPGQSVGIYGVATPASSVASVWGKYLTSDTDEVINKVRKLSPFTVLPANDSIVFPKEGGINGHSFADIYLKYRADKIVNQIEESLDSLLSTTIQDTNKPCIPPREVTALHKTIGDALVFLDHPYDTTKDSVKYVVKGTYNTLAYIGNSVLNGITSIASAITNFGSKNNASVILTEDTDTDVPEIVTSNTKEEEKVVEVKKEVNKDIPRNIEEQNTANEIKQEEKIEVEKTLEPDQVTSTQTIYFGGSGSVPTTPTPDPDITPPVITILGNPSLNIFKNSVYVDAGATALDDIDGVITVSTTGTVDTSILGTYIITYTAIDMANNVSTLTRTVNVLQQIPAELMGHVDNGGFWFDNPSSLTNYTKTIYRGHYPNKSIPYFFGTEQVGPATAQSIACGWICGSQTGEYYWFDIHSTEGHYVFEVHRYGSEQEWEVISPLSLVPSAVIVSQTNSNPSFYTENTIENNALIVDAYQSLGTSLSGQLYSVSIFPNSTGGDAYSAVWVYECPDNPEVSLSGCNAVSVNGSQNLSQDGVSANAFSSTYNPAVMGFVHTFYFNGFQGYVLDPNKYYYLELKVEDSTGDIENVSFAATAFDLYPNGSLWKGGFTDQYTGLHDLYFSLNGSL